MSEQPDQTKQVRPSLYEHRETAATSTFSVLGGVTPMLWTKNKIILTSMSSFILGGVLGGGTVGFIQKNSATIPVAYSQPSVTVQKSLPHVAAVSPPLAVENKTVVPNTVALNTVVLSKPAHQLNTPNNNPLASFEEVHISEKPKKDTNETIRSVTPQKEHAVKKYAKAKSEKTTVEKNVKVEKAKVEKARTEKRKAEKDKTESVKGKAKVVSKSKSKLAQDKDVMLVKSLLDTMERPVAKPKGVIKKATALDQPN